MNTKNAIVTGMCWKNDRGLTHLMFVKYEDGRSYEQGFGGYLLVNENSAAKWIAKIMEILDTNLLCDKDVVGKVVRIKFSDSKDIIAIGHPIKNIWLDRLCFQEDFDECNQYLISR